MSVIAPSQGRWFGFLYFDKRVSSSGKESVSPSAIQRSLGLLIKLEKTYPITGIPTITPAAIFSPIPNFNRKSRRDDWLPLQSPLSLFIPVEFFQPMVLLLFVFTSLLHYRFLVGRHVLTCNLPHLGQELSRLLLHRCSAIQATTSDTS